MNVIGLNETALRSLINSVTENGLSSFPYSVSVHLYREASPNDDLATLNLNLSTDSLVSNFTKLSANAAGILFGTLNVTKSGGKVRLTISPHATSDLFSSSSEVFHKSLTTRNVVDIRNSNTQRNLGDCLIYKPNNLSAITGTTTLSMPPVLDRGAKWGSQASVLLRESFTDKFQGSAGNGYALNIGQRHYPAYSYAGAAAVVFDAPVEADFMYMDLRYTGNTFYNRNVTLEVQNVDNSFTTIGSFTALIEYAQVYTFTKRTIKGLRLLSPLDSINANIYTTYYLQAFTAGLSDYASSPLNNLVRAPYTKAVVCLNLNPTDRSGVHRLPLMTLSVGDTNSSADFKMSSLTSPELTRNSFATQTLIELEA